MYCAPSAITCQYCGGNDVVTDYAAGDVVCRGCGSVLGERLMSEEAEWRDYEDDDRGGSSDAARASYSDSSTYIVGGDRALRKSLNRANMAAIVGRSDVRIGDSATHLTDFAAKLGLSERISVRGATILRDVLKQKVFRRSLQLSLYVAVLYMACRAEGFPRSLRDLSITAGVDARAAGKIFTSISKLLDIDTGRVLPKHLIIRLCSQLDVPRQHVEPCRVVCDRIADLGLLEGSNPSIVAGAAIALQLDLDRGGRDSSGSSVDVVALAAAAGVDQSSISGALLKLQPYAHLLLQPTAEVARDPMVSSSEERAATSLTPMRDEISSKGVASSDAVVSGSSSTAGAAGDGVPTPTPSRFSGMMADILASPPAAAIPSFLSRPSLFPNRTFGSNKAVAATVVADATKSAVAVASVPPSSEEGNDKKDLPMRGSASSNVDDV